VCPNPTDPDSFPTRRSSDLGNEKARTAASPLQRERPQSLRGVCLHTNGRKPIAERSGRILRLGCGRQARRLSAGGGNPPYVSLRSEEHTSELQSRENLVCRL